MPVEVGSPVQESISISCNIHDRIELFVGWQDEGQMDDGDDSFHWEHKSTITIKSN